MKMDLITSLYVFMLAGFIGFEVIRRVSPLLHTPLMSLTNALSAIASASARSDQWRGEGREHLWRPCSAPSRLSRPPADIVGDPIITDRMLKMFKASDLKKK